MQRPGTAQDLVERSKAVAAIAGQHADYGDKHGRIAQPVIDALHSEGLYGMWTPRAIRGGSEVDPISSLQILENVAYSDPSAGWVLMAAALAIGTGAAYLEDEAVKGLFGGDRLPVIAGQGTRPGKAVPVDGGFRLTGSWSFASGIYHATHIHTLGIVETTGEPRIFVLPVGQAKLIDNWDVIGLRGTGSIDYTIDDVFVPAPFTHFAVTETPKRGGHLYTLGIIGFALICHSGWACGIARRMLDELTAIVRSKVGRAGAVGDSDAFQESYANAEASLRSARAFIHETWHEVTEFISRGEKPPLRLQTLMRLSLTNATWSAQEVAAFVYKTSGTVAMRSGVLQRLFRDMNAGTQHITSAPAVIRATGRELAGLAPGKQWRFLDLVDG